MTGDWRPPPDPEGSESHGLINHIWDGVRAIRAGSTEMEPSHSGPKPFIQGEWPPFQTIVVSRLQPPDSKTKQ